MPEEDDASLFWLTVRMPPETDSPEVRLVSAEMPSLRFHVMVRPEASSGRDDWSINTAGVSFRLALAQLGA